MKKGILSLVIAFAVFLLCACGEESAKPNEVPGQTVTDTLYVDVFDTVVVDSIDTIYVDRYHDVNVRDTVYEDPDCETKEVDGMVTISCGKKSVLVYKGSCDSVSFDPAKNFCYEGKILDFCEGFAYNPERFFCYDDVVYPLCGGETYDPRDFKCLSGKLEQVCNGDEFDGSTHFCSERKLYELCNGKDFSPSTEFCFDKRIVSEKCGGEAYDLEKEFCHENGVYPFCNGAGYNATEIICVNGMFMKRCEGVLLDESKNFCYENKQYELCGGEPYIPNVTACVDDKVAIICDGTFITADEQKDKYCQNGKKVAERGSLLDERDGQTYGTVVIGTQTWMSENLNYRAIMSTDDYDSLSFCSEELPNSCDGYGRLYLFDAAIAGVERDEIADGNFQGICPEGWHLPDTSEFRIMVEFVGGEENALTSLRTTTGWVDGYDDDGRNVPGSDQFGFSAMGSGVWEKGYSSNAYLHTGFWTKVGPYYLDIRTKRDEPGVFIKPYGYEHARSIRCVKDES